MKIRSGYLYLFIVLRTIFCTNLFSDIAINDMVLSNITDVLNYGKKFNVEVKEGKGENNKLIFEKFPYMKWEGPNINTKNQAIFISIELNGRIENVEENGLWFWFVSNSSNISQEPSVSVSEFLTVDQSIYGIKSNFNGIGMKINKNKIVSIINENNKKFIEKKNFSQCLIDISSSSLKREQPHYVCDGPDYLDTKFNLRIVFLNGYIFVESYKGTLDIKTEFNLCFISKFLENKADDIKFYVTGGLNHELVTYKIDALAISTIEDFGNTEANNVNTDTEILIENKNKIIDTKLEIISSISKEVFDKTENFNRLLLDFSQFDKYYDDINQMEKMKFDYEIINEILQQRVVEHEHKQEYGYNKNISYHNTLSNNILVNTQSTSILNQKISNLLEIIRNVTFDRITYLKGDPRENLLKSLEDLNKRQNSMNLSIIEMYESTVSAIEDIKHKAEKMEVYQTFQHFIFVLIFLNAMILFGMYKNIREREEREEESTRNIQIKIAV